MKQTIQAAPPYSLVLVMDRTVGKLPASLGRELTAATPTCIAVGTSSASDGLTRITLGAFDPNHTNLSKAFDGVIETPVHRLSVCTALDDILLEMNVRGARTRVQVWVNDSLEPDVMEISVQDCD